MRLLEIQALAFGPFDGESLELCRRMNVVYGPNEAGKSSWHAAMYAGICGRRRGARTKEETEFEARHKPWSGDGWAVVAVIELDDGRTIELHQVLDDPAASRAVDRDTGRDVTQQFFSDGAPDASLLLGLSRDTMFATATVRQAEIVRVQRDAAALQSQLQAATSKAGADSTAEAAINRIRSYASEHVGLRRANSRRPLQMAHNRLDEATDALVRARAAHDDYLELVARRETAEETAREAERRFEAARLATRTARLEAGRARLERARELAAAAPAGERPDLEALEAEEDRLREVLGRWDDRPAEPAAPEGRSARQLERELADLPQPPEGDTEVASEVEAAHEAWRRAATDLAAHDRYRPEELAEATERPAAGPTELRQLAAVLEAPEPRADEALAERLDTLYRRLEPGAARITARVAGAALLVAALVFLVQARPAVWWIATAVLGAAALVFGFRRRGDHQETRREINQLEAKRAIGEEQMHAHFEARQEARRRLTELDLPADALELRSLADRADRAGSKREELAKWSARREELAETLADRRETLERMLAERLEGGEPAAASGEAEGEAEEEAALEARYRLYERQCHERRRQAERAAERPELEQRLEDRRALEKNVEEARSKRAAAERTVLELASELGIGVDSGSGADPAEATAAALRARAAEIDAALPAWRQGEIAARQLEELLSGRRLEDLEAEVASLEESVAAAPEDVEPPDLGDDPEAALAEIERARDEAQRSLSHIEGRITDREKNLPSVPEAEEAVELAKEELLRVERLERTLETTRGFLEAARERVQRDITPHLKQALEADLAKVTGGRYREAGIDPANLEVRVRDADGEWRSASLLSHGTTEQIYLLLRLALVRHLSASGERSPIFLDDPTVQCDTERTVAILEVLEALSAEHQIILFSQEEEVRRWAAARDAPARDTPETVRLIELERRG